MFETQGMLTALSILVMLTAVMAIVSSGCIVRKYEKFLTELSVKRSFSWKNSFIARKLFIVLCSTLVCFLTIGMTSNTMVHVKLEQLSVEEAWPKLLLQFITGVLIFAYHIDTLLDKRKRD